MDPVTSPTASLPPGAAPMLPAEAPLAMPVQSLRHSGVVPRAVLPGTPRGMPWRRAWIFGGTAALTLLATYQLWWAVRAGGLGALEILALALFMGLFTWVAQSFVSAVTGFVLILAGSRRLGVVTEGPLPTVSARTALLMPVYNEDPERVLAGLQAIFESVDATGQGGHFDFFVLSDTTRPEIREREQAAFQAVREATGGQARLFYRHRAENTERKAGNIAEWVQRFGAAYASMLILDADSLMSGETVVRLASAMEVNPGVGLIQTLPAVVNGNTAFARMQQFAGAVYGPVLAHGNAWWHGAEGNYWGHNAIIRTAAFAAHAGLPQLTGPQPFGGGVLSHDFVEAALLRRGGWALHLVPGLGGSYEEGPPSLTDMLVRDRRWCQGNLQHGGVLPARGLHWISRWHLLTGIGHYATAPMWAMLMLIGLVTTMASAGLQMDELVLPGLAESSSWQGPEHLRRFLWVFVLTMVLLLAPKLLGFLLTLADRQRRHACGGAGRMLLGLALETLLTALLAPITMYVQSRGVAEVLAGRDSGWESQRRDDGTLPWSGLLSRYGGATAWGLLGAVWSYAVSPPLMLWMSPVLLGLVLSIPIVAVTAAPGPGRWLRRAGVFRTPEEVTPPPVIARARALRRHPFEVGAAVAVAVAPGPAASLDGAGLAPQVP